jgi:post-segregation antitoxin (ccd killing protein)
VQVTVEIPDEVAAQAEARGVPVEVYVKSLVQQAVPQTLERDRQRRWTPEETRAWLDELAQFSDEIPPMPGETFSREMIYQDHD